MVRDATHEETVKGKHKTYQTIHKTLQEQSQNFTKEKLFLETWPKIKGTLKRYFDSGYKELYLEEILKDIDNEIY